MSESKAVKKGGKNDIVAFSPDIFEEDANLGLENLGQDDLALPSSSSSRVKTQCWMIWKTRRQAISLIRYRIRSIAGRQVFVSYPVLISGAFLSGLLGALVVALL